MADLSVQRWVAGDVPYYVKIWPKLTNPLKTTISNQYSLVAPQP